MFRLNPASVSGDEETFEPFVPKALDRHNRQCNPCGYIKQLYVVKLIRTTETVWQETLQTLCRVMRRPQILFPSRCERLLFDLLPAFKNLQPPPVVDVGWGYVLECLMQAPVIVVVDEAGDGPFPESGCALTALGRQPRAILSECPLAHLAPLRGAVRPISLVAGRGTRLVARPPTAVPAHSRCDTGRRSPGSCAPSATSRPAPAPPPESGSAASGEWQRIDTLRSEYRRQVERSTLTLVQDTKPDTA